MHVDFLLDRFRENLSKTAIIWKDQKFSYEDLLTLTEKNLQSLKELSGKVVSIEGDFSPNATAVLLSLIELGCIIVPMSNVVKTKDEFRSIAEVEAIVKLNSDDLFEIFNEDRTVENDLILRLKKQNHPGLILFSSGSTGKSKAALHDFLLLLEKFKTQKRSSRMITFLLFDHIGGVNTLFSVLSSVGTIITLQDRNPEAVCQTIEKYQVEVLPTSPTFINLLLISEAYENYDMSSLKVITYGTEAMPESTLEKCHEVFPNVKLRQTYGLSELGIADVKSKDSTSLWLKNGSDAFQIRVVDGLLEIKSKSAMLGYLNAPSPFTDDGFFKTGDSVLIDGEYFRILGRKSEMINVGGQKVFPTEIESVIEQLPGVEEVIVSGEENLFTGQIVKAQVKLSTDETLSEFKKRLRTFCKGKLENYKIPQKIELFEKNLHSDRFKKIRHIDI